MFSDNFLVQKDLKLEDALSPQIFNFAIENTVRKIQENQVGLKLNELHQLMAYVDNVNLLGDNKNTVKNNT
jgi:hypothetical protein